MKNAIKILLCLLLLFTLSFSASAQAQPITEYYTEDIYSMLVIASDENTTDLKIRAKSCTIFRTKSKRRTYHAKDT